VGGGVSSGVGSGVGGVVGSGVGTCGSGCVKRACFLVLLHFTR